MDLTPKDSQRGLLSVKERNEAVPRVETPGNQFTYLIVGSKGTGKSNLLLNILEQKLLGLYDNIYFCSNTADEDPKFKSLVDELNTEGKFYSTFNETIINDIYTKVSEYNEERMKPKTEKEPKIAEQILESHTGKPAPPKAQKKPIPPRNLLILDDCMSDLPKSTERHSTLNKLITCARHKFMDIIILVQVLKSMNPIIRKNFDIITIFPSINKQEVRVYYEELGVPDEILDKLIEEALKVPYGNFTINFMNRYDIKYFVNFKPIKFSLI